MFKRTIVAVITFAALLCSGLTANAAKPTQWLIYWYVCGTDIETTRIAFAVGTDLMSDDQNALILAEPTREPGDATRCINEVDASNLSPDVKIFMQAGGTYVWGHPKFRDLNAKIQTKFEVPVRDENGNIVKDEYGNVVTTLKDFYEHNNIVVDRWRLWKKLVTPVEGGNGKIGRYVYDKNHRNWHAREQLPISGVKDSETDMGSQTGLISFLQAGQKLERELYPDGNVRRVFIFVDHGVGSPAGYLYGICTDEYTKNSLSLKEIQNAFAAVKNGWTNPEEKPFEVVAFDACIMSAYETAVAVEDAANYIVASQESTIGKVMFGYTDLLNELSKNPSMSGKELGKVICNATWKDSKVTDKEFATNANDVFTLSVVDLSEQKMNALKTAYENFGAEALNVAQQNLAEMVYTFSKFRNAATVAERYPSSEVDAGLVDLKNFANNLRATFPELKEAGGELVRAIDNAVVYNKRGDALNRGGGLSTYYPSDLFDKDTGAGIKYYNDLARLNLVPESPGKLYNFLYQNMQGKSVDLGALKNKLVEVDEEKKIASVELSEDELKNVAGVRYQCIYIEPRNDDSEKMNTLLLGSDSNVSENRQTGTFELNLNAQKWVTLDGNLLSVQVVSDSTRKNKNGKKIGGNDICVSPVLLNGEAYKLFFSRSYPDEKVTLIGVIKNTDGKITLPNEDLKSLKKGDVVMPLYFQTKNGQLENAHGNSITIGDKPKLEMRTFDHGIFAYVFEFIDPIGGENAFTQEGAVCKIKNGKIVKVIHSDNFENIRDLENAE